MASLFSKLRTLTLGNLHELLDAAIDLNSMAAVKQHIRDLESAVRELTDASNVAGGGVDLVSGEIAALKKQMADANANIELILGDNDASNDYLAESLMQRVIGYEADMETKTEELAAQNESYGAIMKALNALTTKHATMMGSLRRLESLERTTKAKNKGADALEGAAAALGKGADASVDSVERRLKEDAATVNRRFVQVMGTVESGAEAGVAAVQAKARIAAMRAKMAGAKPASGATATGSTETV